MDGTQGEAAGTHECTFCGQHYMSSSGLEDHVRKRHSSGLLTCDTCGKPFRDGIASDHQKISQDINDLMLILDEIQQHFSVKNFFNVYNK